MNPDTAALRDYVTAKDGREYEEVSDTTVCLNVAHSNLSRKFVELRLDIHLYISEVKDKLFKHCGTQQGYMKLYLSDGNNIICPMNDDSKKLGYYPVQHGLTIFIEDLDPYSLAKGGGLDDVSLVKKYEISEEDYDKRTNTVRSYKREQLAKDPNWINPVLAKAKPPVVDYPTGEETIQGMKIGDRCLINPGGRRGCISYLGEVEGLSGSGFWVGVTFDEPVGRSNGSVKGKSYFQCKDKYGGFVRGRNIVVGDFPEEDPFMDSDPDEL